MIMPPSLKSGDTIGVMAPSSRVSSSDLESATKILSGYGYKVFIHPQCYETLHQSAGSHEQKVAALHDLAADKNINAVFFAAGGNRALHLLDGVDYDLIAANPKIYMGFSDCTALLNAIAARSSLVTYHGPVLKRIPTTLQIENDFALLEGRTKEIPLNGAQILKDGKAEGTLIGGNMSLLFAMNQNDFCASDNYILFMEDVAEEYSHVDRMLCAMKRRGVLQRANAIVFGQFTDMKDDGKIPFGFSLDDIIAEHTSGLNIPILTNAPFGHGQDMTAFPIGAKARLEKTMLTIL